MPSPALVLVPPIKKAGKKRRPTFRPASQRSKASAAKDSWVAPENAAPAASNERSVTPASLTEAENDPLQTQREDDDDEIVNEAAAGSTASAAAPANKRKKRKVVAVGSSRPDETEQVVPAHSEGQLALVELQVPDAAPGQATLKTFCSKFRTKGEKRNRATQNKTAKAPAQQQNAPAQQSTANTGPVVQVVNGEIVLQESSVVVPGARRSVQEVEEEFEQVIEEEAQHSAVVGASYNSFVSRRAPQHWSLVETKTFYSALRQVGLDFATMSAYFDNRTRKQLKRKYQIENTKNPHLIELALSPQSQIPLDLSVFNMEAGTSDQGTSSTNTTTTSTEGDNAERTGTSQAGVHPPGIDESERAEATEEAQQGQETAAAEVEAASAAQPEKEAAAPSLPKPKQKARRAKFRASRNKGKS